MRAGTTVGEGLDRLDGQAVVRLADLLRVVVEEGDDVEAPAAEPPVPQQGPPEVAQPDQGRAASRGRSPGSRRSAAIELLDPIADPGIAELAEEGQVLADLGVVDRQRRPEQAAGDRLVSLALEGFELSQVEADPAHHGLGGQLLSLGIASRVPHGLEDSGEGVRAKSMPCPLDRMYRPVFARVKGTRRAMMRAASPAAGCRRRAA